jgi:hypothetical protein
MWGGERRGHLLDALLFERTKDCNERKHIVFIAHKILRGLPSSQARLDPYPPHLVFLDLPDGNESFEVVIIFLR